MPLAKSTTARLILAARALLLCAAVALAATGILVALRDEGASHPTARGYSCPMHPEVVSAAPGQCPICKMALEPMDKPGSSGAKPSTEHPPDCPMHPKDGSSAEKPKPAALVPAQSVPDVGSNTTTQFAAGVTWLPETHPPAARVKPSDRPVLGTPKRRVFVDDVRAPAWLETPGELSAVLYRDELVGLAPGERATFYRSAAPREPIAVRLSDEAPVAWDASTSRVRFVVEPALAEPKGASAASGAAPTPRAGDVGWLELEDESRELLVFPESALLRSNEGPYVLVAGAGDDSFTRRPLQIGRILKGQVVVLSGLRDDDRIVLSSAFFLDTERGREPKTEPLAGVGP